MKKPEVSFKLHVNFGYRESSPIPYKQTGHKNLESVVPAVPGTKAELFPGKRTECIEFLSYIEDENGTPCGIRCNFRECSESLEKVLRDVLPPLSLRVEVGASCSTVLMD